MGQFIHNREQLVTLIDGRQVDSSSEEWRHECEARAILAIPGIRWRRAHLYGEMESVRINGKWTDKRTIRGIEQVRGKAEVQRLEATMTALWRASRQRAAG